MNTIAPFRQDREYNLKKFNFQPENLETNKNIVAFSKARKQNFIFKIPTYPIYYAICSYLDMVLKLLTALDRQKTTPNFYSSSRQVEGPIESSTLTLDRQKFTSGSKESDRKVHLEGQNFRRLLKFDTLSNSNYLLQQLAQHNQLEEAESILLISSIEVLCIILPCTI